MPTLVAELRDQQQRMLAALEALTEVESPSTNLEAARSCAARIAELGQALLGRPPALLDAAGRTHLRWDFGEPRVLLLAHLDTVWPLGTLARWPFSVRDGRATGPGVFDMKAGLVQGLFALAAARARGGLDGVCLLVTSDEEIGSPTSRPLIEAAATGASAALVLEPSAGGALKTARKGVGMYTLSVTGRAAHAGLEPERGANALVEMATQVLTVQALSRSEAGTTVTPTVASAGSGGNVVPARASLGIDVRAASSGEQDRVDQAVRGLRPTVPGTSISISGGANRPVLEPRASAALFARAQRLADVLGLPAISGVAVGGGSDGNFTAAAGVPTLDGLGAVGDGAHAEGEHVLVDAMPQRAALVAALVADLLDHP